VAVSEITGGLWQDLNLETDCYTIFTYLSVGAKSICGLNYIALLVPLSWLISWILAAKQPFVVSVQVYIYLLITRRNLL
jgi:hypothetical protein